MGTGGVLWGLVVYCRDWWWTVGTGGVPGSTYYICVHMSPMYASTCFHTTRHTYLPALKSPIQTPSRLRHLHTTTPHYNCTTQLHHTTTPGSQPQQHQKASTFASPQPLSTSSMLSHCCHTIPHSYTTTQLHHPTQPITITPQPITTTSQSMHSHTKIKA